MSQTKKTGLVLEGGALRGLFTAGVMDVMMENNITFDGAIGTSAGAAFGVNYKSRQIGRVIRYNKRFITNPDYCSFRSLIKTGNYFNVDFCYRRVPEELDPLDLVSYQSNPMTFYCTATDLETGKAIYYHCADCGRTDTKWIQASASMPLFSTIVEIEDKKLLDGGVADSIPLVWFESQGYNHNIVILTQPLGYIKQPNHHMGVVKARYRHYPNFVKAMEARHENYNQTTALIRYREQQGSLLVIRPPESLNISSTTRDPNELQRVYQIGRSEGTRRLNDIQNWMNMK